MGFKVELDKKKCLVVIGEPGIDEISISGKSTVFVIEDGSYKRYKLDPVKFGIDYTAYDKLPAGDADGNFKIFNSLLENKADDAIRDMVCINSGAAFFCFGKTGTIKEGLELSRELLGSGKVKEFTAGYIEKTKNA